MRQILFTLSWLILVLSITRCSFFKPNTVTIKVKPAEYVTEDLPVFAGIQIPDNFKGMEAENIGITLNSKSFDKPQSGQLIKCADGEYKICWILPETNQNKSTKWKAEFHKPDESAET